MILFVWLLCPLSLTNAADSKAYIKLELDSTEVYPGDTVVLDVESTGLGEPLDITLLKAQANILRETFGSSIAIIGGKPAEVTMRRIDIVPKKTGVMVIGPLTVGDVTSNSVYLKVLDTKRPEWTPHADDLKIKSTLSSTSVMVNQKVLLTIELLHRYPISNESFTLPKLKGLPKRALIENRRTIAGDNREWFRTAWEYLIFPDRSGSIQINGITWSGNTAKSRAEKSPFTRQSQPQTLEVSPPVSADANWWLPASALTLTEEWSQPPTKLRAGDELNRIIRVEAESVLAGQIPTPVILESRAVQQTLINSHRNETLIGDNIVSTAEFIYRVKAQSPVPVFLDTVRIPWWSTIENTNKEAIIPARRINVGLPDRADVLSQLALQETGVNRMKHWLQSADLFRMLMLMVGVISGFYILFALAPVFMSRYQQDRARKQRVRELKHLARTGDINSLYRELHSAESKQLFNPLPLELTQMLEARLFSTGELAGENSQIDHKSRLHIKNLLNELVEQPAPNRATFAENDDVLAKL